MSIREYAQIFNNMNNDYVDDPNREILSKAGVAKLYKLSTRTVDNLLRKGLPHLKIGNRRCRFVREEVIQWMKEQFHTVRRA